MTAGRKAYLIVSLVLIPLGYLAAIACFCVHPLPIAYLGVWMVVGFPWSRTAFLVAHVVTGAAYVVTHITVLSAGAGSAANYGKLIEDSKRMGLVTAGVVGLIAFGTAFFIDRARHERSRPGEAGHQDAVGDEGRA